MSIQSILILHSTLMTGTRPTLPAGRRGAFTLLELLIVIAVIAILAAVAMPVLHIVHIKAKRTEAKHEALNLANAIRAYDAEYSEYPIPEGEAGSDYYETRTGLELMAVLTGEDEVMNPRRLQFYQGKNARGEVAGLMRQGGQVHVRLIDLLAEIVL